MTNLTQDLRRLLILLQFGLVKNSYWNMIQFPKQVIMFIHMTENAVEVGTYNFTLTTVPSSKNVEGTFTGTFKVVRNELTGTFVTKLGQKPAGTNALPVSVTGAYYTGKEITIPQLQNKDK